MLRYAAVTTRRIIPRTEHPISRRNLSPNAVRVLYRLKENNFQAYLVGGCVRDLLLGREPKDFDIVTDATPAQMKRLFRNCRLVGRRFRLAHLHFKDEVLEVATFRAAAGDDLPEATGPEEVRPPLIVRDDAGMILRDNQFGTPEEDARRRDFTVNALSYNIADFTITDHVGGLADLERGIIRTIGNPVERFTEDPVRMLRAIRFAALLGFEIEPSTWQALVELAPHSANAAPPRLYEELLKLFLSGEGERCYQLLRQSGVFAALLPPVHHWLETESDGFPHARFGRVLAVLDLRVSAGETIAPPLLLALLFGEYLEEQALRLRREGLSPQEALDTSVAHLMENLAPTVLIPHRTGLAMRSILSSRSRFQSTPGRRPQSFIARPGFAEALRYLALTVEATGEERELLAWWERYRDGNPAPAPLPQQPVEETNAPRRRKRRRRRRARSGANDTHKDES